MVAAASASSAAWTAPRDLATVLGDVIRKGRCTEIAVEYSCGHLGLADVQLANFLQEHRGCARDPRTAARTLRLAARAAVGNERASGEDGVFHISVAGGACPECGVGTRRALRCGGASLDLLSAREAPEKAIPVGIAARQFADWLQLQPDSPEAGQRIHLTNTSEGGPWHRLFVSPGHLGICLGAFAAWLVCCVVYGFVAPAQALVVEPEAFYQQVQDHIANIAVPFGSPHYAHYRQYYLQQYQQHLARHEELKAQGGAGSGFQWPAFFQGLALGIWALVACVAICEYRYGTVTELVELIEESWNRWRKERAEQKDAQAGYADEGLVKELGGDRKVTKAGGRKVADMAAPSSMKIPSPPTPTGSKKLDSSSKGTDASLSQAKTRVRQKDKTADIATSAANEDAEKSTRDATQAGLVEAEPAMEPEPAEPNEALPTLTAAQQAEAAAEAAAAAAAEDLLAMLSEDSRPTRRASQRSRARGPAARIAARAAKRAAEAAATAHAGNPPADEPTSAPVETTGGDEADQAGERCEPRADAEDLSNGDARAQPDTPARRLVNRWADEEVVDDASDTDLLSVAPDVAMWHGATAAAAPVGRQAQKPASDDWNLDCEGTTESTATTEEPLHGRSMTEVSGVETCDGTDDGTSGGQDFAASAGERLGHWNGWKVVRQSSRGGQSQDGKVQGLAQEARVAEAEPAQKQKEPFKMPRNLESLSTEDLVAILQEGDVLKQLLRRGAPVREQVLHWIRDLQPAGPRKAAASRRAARSRRPAGTSALEVESASASAAPPAAAASSSAAASSKAPTSASSGAAVASTDAAGTCSGEAAQGAAGSDAEAGGSRPIGTVETCDPMEVFDSGDEDGFGFSRELRADAPEFVPEACPEVVGVQPGRNGAKEIVLEACLPEADVSTSSATLGLTDNYPEVPPGAILVACMVPVGADGSPVMPVGMDGMMMMPAHDGSCPLLMPPLLDGELAPGSWETPQASDEAHEVAAAAAKAAAAQAAAAKARGSSAASASSLEAEARVTEERATEEASEAAGEAEATDASSSAPAV